ncbi:MAG: 4-hydroxybenzoate octaprenyltransferase [Planctomycetota bacterium]
MTTASTHERVPLATQAALIAGDIKLAHSIFALPFALLGAFLGAPRDDADAIRWGVFAGQLALVLVCMVTARTWAMLVNRIADRRIDAGNERTARRVFASGALDAKTGLIWLAGSAIAFFVGCAGFLVFFGNPWPLIGGAPILGWLTLYSFTKRFTALCHLVLGVALAISPIAAAVAAGGIEAATAPVLWLAAMVALWVAGFDVIYALQDLDFDRSRGLKSIPAALGWRGAVWASRAMHAGTIAALVLAWLASERLGIGFSAAVVAAAGLLVVEHAVLAVRGKEGIGPAFFTANGVLGLVVGAIGIGSVLV